MNLPIVISLPLHNRKNVSTYSSTTKFSYFTLCDTATFVYLQQDFDQAKALVQLKVLNITVGRTLIIIRASYHICFIILIKIIMTKGL